MNSIKKRPLLYLSIALFGLSIFIRYQIYNLSNEDVVILQDWYHHFFKRGVASLANGNFSNYTPAYLYLLYLTRVFSDWFGSMVAIKIIPTIFDLLSAFAIFLMARIKFEDDKPYLFSAIFFVLPTIMFNSTGWGQIESLYTSFLLLCAYFLLKEKPFWAYVYVWNGVFFQIPIHFLFTFSRHFISQRKNPLVPFFSGSPCLCCSSHPCGVGSAEVGQASSPFTLVRWDNIAAFQ